VTCVMHPSRTRKSVRRAAPRSALAPQKAPGNRPRAACAGKGRLTGADGGYYEGAWEAGERTRGREVSADAACVYDGEWRSGQRHGQGVLHQAGLSTYTGADGGRLHGSARWQRQMTLAPLPVSNDGGGSPCAGAWEAGMQHGQGRCAWADGSEYEGAWAEGARCGAGRFATAGGHVHMGAWQGDAPHGLGFCRTAAGDRYRGGWAAGQRSGVGACAYASGDRYEGAWAADARCGKGTCLYASGDAYQGARMRWHHGQARAPAFWHHRQRPG